MGDFLTEIKTVKARKEHECCCYRIVTESGYQIEDFDKKYHEQLKKMKVNGGKIEAGEEYFMWSGSYDGEMFTARANQIMHDLVCEMEWLDN